jgi:long-chain acyl-CoA synthetase
MESRVTKLSLAAQARHHWGSEIEEIEVLGHPCPSFVRRPGSMPEILLDARLVADRPYLVQGDRRLSFAAHDTAVDAVAEALADVGVGPGDRVLLLGANSIEWTVGFWAVLSTGAIVVLGNAWWSPDEVAHAVDTVAPSVILVDDRRLPLVPPTLRCLTTDALRDIYESGPRRILQAPAIAEDDPAVILFTSGTTGMPKGAVLSHRGIVATLQSLLVRTKRLPVEGAEPAPGSRALLSVPLFHIGGLQQIITPMVTGGTVVFSVGRFDPARVVGLLETEQIRAWSTVPTMANRVMDHLEETGHEPMMGLRTVGLGGSPVGEHLRARVRQWFPNATRGLAVTYGLSEAGGVVTTAAGEPVMARPGTVGNPLETTVVRIDQPDESGCGEVLVRSPSVMLGYWAHQSSGEAADIRGPVTDDRWLRTGDIGRLDNDGFLYITDRSKDIVIRGGENVATSHVEDVLMRHPDVREVAVVGLPHPSLGEEVGAAVVLQNDVTVTGEQLSAFALEHLAYFEVPSCWWFVTEPLPQNATGKVLKRTIRDTWPPALRAVPAT